MGTQLYFYSYVLITMYVLVNVAIAILLEKLMGDIMVPSQRVYQVRYSGQEYFDEKSIYDKDGNLNKQNLNEPKDDHGVYLDPSIRIFTEQEQRDVPYSVYIHARPTEVKDCIESIEHKNMLIRAKGGEEDDEAWKIDEQDEQRRSMIVERVEEVKPELYPEKPKWSLVKVIFKKPVENQVRNLVSPDGKKEPELRSPERYDGLLVYEYPPEDLQDMMDRVSLNLFYYIDMLAWRVECCCLQLDMLNQNKSWRQYELPRTEPTDENPQGLVKIPEYDFDAEIELLMKKDDGDDDWADAGGETPNLPGDQPVPASSRQRSDDERVAIDVDPYSNEQEGGNSTIPQGNYKETTKIFV